MKTQPHEFGGGRTPDRPPYTVAGLARLLCARAGCGRKAYATWGACADGNMQRPLCPECDVAVNAIVLTFVGDPDIDEKLDRYMTAMEEQIGRPLDRPSIGADLIL